MSRFCSLETFPKVHVSDVYVSEVNPDYIMDNDSNYVNLLTGTKIYYDKDVVNNTLYMQILRYHNEGKDDSYDVITPDDFSEEHRENLVAAWLFALPLPASRVFLPEYQKEEYKDFLLDSFADAYEQIKFPDEPVSYSFKYESDDEDRLDFIDIFKTKPSHIIYDVDFDSDEKQGSFKSFIPKNDLALFLLQDDLTVTIACSLNEEHNFDGECHMELIDNIFSRCV